MSTVESLRLRAAKYQIRFQDLRFNEKKDLIGSGRFSDVYSGYWKNREVAIKLYRNVDDSKQKQLIMREFSATIFALARARHANIVKYYGSGSDDGRLYIVTERVKGVSLDKYLEKHGTMDYQQVLFVALQIAEAVRYLHAHEFVHCDIKPRHILVTQSLVVKVADFGLAKRIEQLQTAQNFDSSHYVWTAPEMFSGRYGKEVDIWSFGAVILQMLRGRQNFIKDSGMHEVIGLKCSGDLKVEIPQDNVALAKLISEMIAHDPTKRPSIEQVAMRLQRLIDVQFGIPEQLSLQSFPKSAHAQAQAVPSIAPSLAVSGGDSEPGKAGSPPPSAVVASSLSSDSSDPGSSASSGDEMPHPASSPSIESVSSRGSNLSALHQAETPVPLPSSLAFAARRSLRERMEREVEEALREHEIDILEIQRMRTQRSLALFGGGTLFGAVTTLVALLLGHH